MVASAPEAEWDEEQQGWMLALAEYRAGACPCGCGERFEQSTASEMDGRYKVGLPTRCHARTALLIAQKAYDEQPQSEALLFTVGRG